MLDQSTIEFYYHRAAIWIGSTAGIITGLTIIWNKFIYPILVRRVILPIKVHAANISALSDMASELRALMPKMSLVVQSVLPNSGSSMADALNRLELAVMALQAKGDTNSAIAEALLWNHPKAMFRCDDTGHNLFVNNAYADLLKVDNECLLGLNWRSYVHYDDLLGYDALWNSALKEHRSCWFHIRMVDSEGETIDTSVQFTVLRCDNKFCGFLGIIETHPKIPHK